MKRGKQYFRLILFAVALIMLCSLTVPALAHSGKTDEDGGHYDSETGEYHYHHGYPAHDHYDMDGDGYVDCPYDFDDRTGWNSGSSGSSTQYSTNTVEQEVKTVPVLTVVLIFAAFCLALIVAILKILNISDESLRYQTRLVESKHEVNRLSEALMSKEDTIAEQEIHIVSLMNRAEELTEELFYSERRYYQHIYGSKTKAEIMNAPMGGGIDSDGMPYCFTQIDDERKWGDYTAFIAIGSKRFHGRRRCSGATIPINAVNIDYRALYPCERCKPAFPDLMWYNQYNAHMAIILRYDLDLKDQDTYQV